MLLIPKNGLRFPTGVTPGFDPSHPLAGGRINYLSMVPIAGNHTNLLTGIPLTRAGTVSQGVDDLGPYTSHGPGCVTMTTTTNTGSAAQRTYAMIIRPTSVAATCSIVNDSSTAYKNSLRINSGGKISVLVNNGAQALSTNTSLVANTPYFVAAYMRGSQSVRMTQTNLYTGEVTSCTVAAGSTLSAGDVLTFGTQLSDGTTVPYTGRIYAAFVGTIYPNLLSQAKLTENPWALWYPTPTVWRIGISGPQTLTPTLFTNTQTFPAATVSSTYGLTPSLVTNTQTFYAPTVSTANTLTPSLVTNTQTFGAATIGRGSVDLTPSLFTNTNTFYSATVINGTPLTPSLFTNTQTFYAPTVAPGAVTLTPSLVTNTQTFYAPTVGRGTVTLTPSLATNSQTFYGPTVTKSNTILPDLFTNSTTFFPATIVGGSSPATGANNIVTTRRRRRSR